MISEAALSGKNTMRTCNYPCQKCGHVEILIYYLLQTNFIITQLAISLLRRFDHHRRHLSRTQLT